ncbi:single-stranded DNA-binding protein [Nocardioides sp. KR10-350]|uniref:single-stranded DNA-binding protein n=1 Tax=Nocardioides cheoyonin TaxID=3156615 RepID=UPI0032B4C9F3
MNQSMITVQGYVGGEPVLRNAGGHKVANFRVAVTPRRLNRNTGEWADSPTQWYTVNAWRKLGENAARSLRKGDAVVVHGRLMARSYTNKDGIEVNTFEIEASVVGHDLNRGSSMLMKNEGRRSEEDPEAAAIEQARRDWGGPLPMSEPPGFERDRPDPDLAPDAEPEAPAPAA